MQPTVEQLRQQAREVGVPKAALQAWRVAVGNRSGDRLAACTALAAEVAGSGESERIGTALLTYTLTQFARFPDQPFEGAIEALVECGANPFVYFEANGGFTEPQQEVLFALLGKQDAQGVRLRMADGGNVLHHAASHYAPWVLASLLGDTALPAHWLNEGRHDGATPLLVLLGAMRANNTPIGSAWTNLGALLVAGADPGLKDGQGRHAGDYLADLEARPGGWFQRDDNMRGFCVHMLKTYFAEQEASQMQSSTPAVDTASGRPRF